MKICFFGIYDSTYSRNSVLLAGLRAAGAEVIECREDWRDPERYRKLRQSLKALNNDYDFVYAAYPSPVPTILAKLISRKPVISDAFYSMFDSVVNDRRKFLRWSPRAIKLLILDWLGVLFADRVIVDTNAHKEYWSKWFLVNPRKISTVYLGINDEVFKHALVREKDYTLVSFQGTYIPLQGAVKIVEAANLCRDHQDIRFRMVGNGREYPLARALADRYGLGNIEFVGQVPLAQYYTYMVEADIILGIFGDRKKTTRVIPNKVYEGLAVGRAVITMDTGAVREIFTDADMLMVRNDSRSIADGIIKLAADRSLRQSLAKHGYATVSRYRPVEIGRSLLHILDKHK